jgi:hypothetical protein
VLRVQLVKLVTRLGSWAEVFFPSFGLAKMLMFPELNLSAPEASVAQL